MGISFDRRKLFGVTLLAAASPLAARPYCDLLFNSESNFKIFKILEEHLGLEKQHLSLVPDFVLSLQTRYLHAEHPEAFAKILKDQSASNELSAYLVEEFLVSSNYFAYRSGEAAELMLIERGV